MFKKLCGDDFYPRVKLVTTMWDCVVESEAEEREKELVSKSDFWETMIKGGASTKRHWGTQESAMHILADVIGNRSVDAPKHLKVQSELVDEHKTLDQTSAGRQFEVELVKQREKHEKEIKEMKEEVQMLMDMNQQRAAAEIEKQRQMFEQRIAQSFEDQAKLKSSLDDVSWTGVPVKWPCVTDSAHRYKSDKPPSSCVCKRKSKQTKQSTKRRFVNLRKSEVSSVV